MIGATAGADYATREPRVRKAVEPLDDLLAQALRRLGASDATNIGFPRASDLCYRAISPFLGYMINNIGHPQTAGIYPAHVKDIEQRVMSYFAKLFGATRGWDGYLTTGGTEGNLYGLAVARGHYPGAMAYVSSSAHYSAAKATRLLNLPTVIVPTLAHGEIDYDALRRLAAEQAPRPAIAVCTAGTTMYEAVDSVPQVRLALAEAGVDKTWIHTDAAMAGPHLALTGRDDFGLGTASGSDSISVSGHKWYGTPVPCGVVLNRRSSQEPGHLVDYIGAADTTISGSRSGLAAILLWHALTQITRAGADQHRLRAERARAVAAYAHDRLTEIGWPCWRNPDAVTVVLQSLPAELLQRWPLPSEDGWAHLVCMPGVSHGVIEQLVNDLTSWRTRQPQSRAAKPYHRLGVSVCGEARELHARGVG
jgi:histidine decarboxylase